MAAFHSAAQQELSDLRLLPSNVMRTLPYTTYIAVGSYAVLCWSREAALLEVCLLTNEILNAVFKKLSTLLLGKEARWLRRPRGAADSGIYPQHFPKLSTSSGMPSGHAQTSTLFATIFTCYVLDLQPQADPDLPGMKVAPLEARNIVPLVYVWLVAICVMLSRTRFGGPLAVNIGGRAIVQHSLLQIFVGASIGFPLGVAAFWLYLGQRGWWLGVVLALVVMSLVTVLASIAQRIPPPKVERKDSESADNDTTGSGTPEGTCFETNEARGSAEHSPSSAEPNGYEPIGAQHSPGSA